VLPRILERYSAWKAGERPDMSTLDDVRQDKSPPPLNSFEQVMFHFQVISHKVRCCANSECPAPYFLTTKKGQRYCSSKCSAPAQKEAKRRWWNEHGSKQRSARSKTNPRRKDN
jgi:hypothetical protein